MVAEIKFWQRECLSKGCYCKLRKKVFCSQWEVEQQHADRGCCSPKSSDGTAATLLCSVGGWKLHAKKTYH